MLEYTCKGSNPPHKNTMIKLYITAIDSRENGTAVTLFEDHLVTYTEKEYVGEDTELGQEIFNKIEAVEKINNQTSSPF